MAISVMETSRSTDTALLSQLQDKYIKNSLCFARAEASFICQVAWGFIILAEQEEEEEEGGPSGRRRGRARSKSAPLQRAWGQTPENWRRARTEHLL